MIKRIISKQPAKVTYPTITQRTAQGGIAKIDKSGQTVIVSGPGLAAPIRKRD